MLNLLEGTYDCHAELAAGLRHRAAHAASHHAQLQWELGPYLGAHGALECVVSLSKDSFLNVLLLTTFLSIIRALGDLVSNDIATRYS